MNSKFRLYALECKIDTTMRTANESYIKYDECGPELASLFCAKNRPKKQALLGWEVCGA
jgi:hypothetical protein